MERTADAEGARYRAFISYSHRDGAVGRRLHRRLEAYALPRRLVGKPSRWGPTPARLSPIFRDREELSAAGDLSAEVRAALQASESLVVICSPNARASEWVAKEIELFRALHPDRPVLAALVAGEPADAFPDALLHAGPDSPALEPLAADLRSEGDGDRLGLLKLIAGILGLRLDELVQRDAQQRVVRVTAVTVAALIATLGMAGLTIYALQARADALRQRAEAEGLVEFMLTDLRSRLQGVGRLDVLGAVNARALKYYSDQDLKRLPPASLERRARILHAMGEDDLGRGKPELALKEFGEARRSTSALLAADPDDQDRIFSHAQSEYWMATVPFRAGRYDESEAGFVAYDRLAHRLMAIDPHSLRNLQELGYAQGDLCSLRVYQLRKGPEVLELCRKALEIAEQVAARSPGNREAQTSVATRRAWLADALALNGHAEEADAQRRLQVELLTRLSEADPKDLSLQKQLAAAERGLARREFLAGDVAGARARYQLALRRMDAIIRFEPAHKDWVVLRDKIAADLADLPTPDA